MRLSNFVTSVNEKLDDVIVLTLSSENERCDITGKFSRVWITLILITAITPKTPTVKSSISTKRHYNKS